MATKTKQESKRDLAVIGEYKGSPVISLKRNKEDKFPFSFGVGKAKLILDHVESIKSFVASAGNK